MKRHVKMHSLAKNTRGFQSKKGSVLFEPTGACHLTSQMQAKPQIPEGMTHSDCPWSNLMEWSLGTLLRTRSKWEGDQILGALGWVISLIRNVCVHVHQCYQWVTLQANCWEVLGFLAPSLMFLSYCSFSEIQVNASHKLLISKIGGMALFDDMNSYYHAGEMYRGKVILIMVLWRVTSFSAPPLARAWEGMKDSQRQNFWIVKSEKNTQHYHLSLIMTIVIVNKSWVVAAMGI